MADTKIYLVTDLHLDIFALRLPHNAKISLKKCYMFTWKIGRNRRKEVSANEKGTIYEFACYFSSFFSCWLRNSLGNHYDDYHHTANYHYDHTANYNHNVTTTTSARRPRLYPRILEKPLGFVAARC